MKAFCGDWVKIINGCMVILLVASAVLYPPPVSAAPHAAQIASGDVQADPAETRMPEPEALLSEATLSAPPLEVVSTTETVVPSETASTEMVTPTETSSTFPRETTIPTATQTNTPDPIETSVPAATETTIPDPSETLSALLTPDSSPTATMEVPIDALPEATLAVPSQTPKAADNTLKIQTLPGMLNSDASVNNKIAAGGEHTCALTTEGGIKCWGRNYEGQLGDDSTFYRLTPTDVSGLDRGISAIKTGRYHTCALTIEGGVKCWGYNGSGQLGDGTSINRSTPTNVIGLGTVAAINTGGYHTCALMTSGGVKCWGDNSYGQLGDNTNTSRYTPVDVSMLGSGVAAIITGEAHTCALMINGEVKCWGYNQNGQLGDGTTINRYVPVSVNILGKGTASITAGLDYTCSLTTGGMVKCWGNNYYGQLGDGTGTNSLTPVNVSGLGSGVIAIAAGYLHMCALITGGEVKCWGWNENGQLGDDTYTNRLTPVSVNELGNWIVAVTAGDSHTCALTTEGGVKCWGENYYGQLGDGTYTNHLTPVGVLGFSPPGATSLSSPSGSINTKQPVFIWNSAPYTTDYRLNVTNGSEEIINQVFNAEQVECGSGAEQCALALPSELPDGNYTWKIQTQNSYGDGEWSSVLNFSVYTGSCWSVSLSASPWWEGNPSVMNTSAKCNNGKFAPGEIVQLTPGTQTNYTFSRWSGDLTGTGTEFSMPDRNAVAVAWFIRSAAPAINKIAAGYRHTCASMTGGGVKCWGYNEYGQLGDGTTTNRLTPADVSGLSSGVSAIAAGYSHTCALTTGGAVKCWGYNGYGQLGDGTTSNRWTAVDVSGLGSGVTAIAVGGDHTCALTTSGMVKCWGYNYYGQLGDGTNTWHYTPVIISSLGNGITAITAGDNHTCVSTIGGAVKCWGQNDYGQLGDGTTTNRTTPVDIRGLTSGVSTIAAGYDHTCALMSGGAVKCWGYNVSGQLGDGTTTNRWTAVGVSGLSSGASAIAAGYYHTCALITGGTVKCWGENYYGQLGDGTNTYRYTPAYVIELGSGVAAITAGHEHTCALTTGGGVKCWGYNESGQLGDGTTSDRWTPVGVTGYAQPDAANLISPSGGINATQPTFVWNAVPDTTDYHLSLNNSSGEIINQWFSAAQVNCDSGSGQCSLVAPSVLPDGNYTWKVQTKNSYGGGESSSEWYFFVYTGSCWSVNLTANPTVAGNPRVINTSAKCNAGKFAPGETVQITPGTQPNYAFSQWSGDLTGKVSVFRMLDQGVTISAEFIASGLPAINKVTAGYSHTCALTTGGAVKCWGDNYYGQLGDGTTSNRLIPVNVSGLGSGMSTIAAGYSHTCALTTGGGVKCWGYNGSGQLGDGTTSDRYTPVDVSGLGSGVAAIAAGGYHTCALTLAGMVKCWGANWRGQLGDSTTTQRYTPVDVSGLDSGVTAITAGDYHTCALTKGGGVKCWGDNERGQLGDGTTNNHLSAVDVRGLNMGVAAITTGYQHTCALTMEGGVTCWGYNNYGQLGDGTTNNRLTAVNVSGLSSGVAAIAAGYYHTCALTSGSAVKCWGHNGNGQLGDGTYTNRLTPVSVNELGNWIVAVTAGDSHTCALTTGGGVKCWGGNWRGQLGDGTDHSSSTPVGVIGFSPPNVILVSPKVAITNPRPTYTWTAARNATAYDLYIDNSLAQTLTPTSANCTTLTRNCTATPAKYLTAGIHNWKIAVRNTYGSSYSTLLSFIQLSPIYGFDSQFNGSMSGLYGAQGMWFVNSTSLYSNTLATIIGPAPGHHYQASIYYNANFTTLDYQVQVMRTGCDTCATKLFMRGDGIPVFAGWKNGYQFNIKRNGYYYVGKTVNGTLYTIKNWTRSTAIKTASNWNLLRVTAKGSSLKFYINGVQVWSGSDTARNVGKVGLGLYSNGTGGVNRLYVNYATLTTTVLSAPRADNSSQTQDMTKPEKIDPLGGNY